MRLPASPALEVTLMLEKILQLLAVSCSHRKMSQPFTAASDFRPVHASASGSPWESVGPAKSHYVVCLECGKKFQYDWNEMRVVR
jgi:predicted transcriptional regulator